MNRRAWNRAVRGTWLTLIASAVAVPARAQSDRAIDHFPDALKSFVESHCLDCHNSQDRTAGLDLESLIEQPMRLAPDDWEKVARKLFVRQMPPPDWPRPKEQDYRAAQSSLEAALDRLADERPNPGRTSTFRRLNRTEYQNAIRDLLDIEIDATAWLPEDQASHGFDNITVEDLAPTHLERFITAAQRISRLAVGAPGRVPSSETFRVRADRTQEQHMEGLPIGTRGGVLIPYWVPISGEYEIEVRLARDRNEEVEGLTSTHHMELLLDRRRVGLFEINPPSNPTEHALADRHLRKRIEVTAGSHQLGVTFLQNGSSLAETLRQPYQARFNMHRHPRLAPAVFQVSITGPHGAANLSDFHTLTPSRRLLIARPTESADEDESARGILTHLMQRAYRRPLTDADLDGPMTMFRGARDRDGFHAGIEAALSAILVSPHFLFRIERDPDGAAAHSAYRLDDMQLASRLSFFLWSSIPDDELRGLAEQGALSQPEVLDRQIQRMLADTRSHALAANFAGQWLHLRNLESFTPDQRLFTDFDDNLRQSLRRETEMFFFSMVRENRSVLELLDADFTFLNERLAKHYGIPHVYGNRFRRVPLDDQHRRGGLLRHGSVLAVTSYATRTSPVLRGKWVLENVIGTPPPPPPANVPPLDDHTVAANLTVRERLAAHRSIKTCANCHDRIDPVGLALENYDAIGRWRATEAGQPVDATGSLPDGTELVGADGLETALLQRPEWFVRTVIEKLMTYALGRGLEPYDAPAVRKVLASAQKDEYRFTTLVVGIAHSVPFQMRVAE